MRKKFRIIPVLDLKEGMVVGGNKGERAKYQPIKSRLTSSAELSDVLQAFHQHFGFTEFYIADLDALISHGERNQLSLISQRKIVFPHSLMLDAGIRNVDSATEIIGTGVEKIIIGTETLLSLEALRKIIKTFGSQQLVMSIDTKEAKVLSPSPAIAGLSPSQVLSEASKAGIREFILLQLARVGTGGGIDKTLIQDCLRTLKAKDGSSRTLILGGGVSGYEDLKWLADNGVEGALVATCLHEGRLNRETIEALQNITFTKRRCNNDFYSG